MGRGKKVETCNPKEYNRTQYWAEYLNKATCYLSYMEKPGGRGQGGVNDGSNGNYPRGLKVA